ncbi:rhomboid family intramembrane serine protease [Staphylococcus xylosus]|uniref:rhomboid family intramembrane serine protease n=1 Tax=Staphylococcus xylosus TaxID=1288 RepID=UPI00298EDC95|nr:rhomboid family intramembrane serine protease [Staphylococcus xylosus]MDW8553900.1 rhomboid family intramembrane serine protease [Staphylococcus xylosus]
MIIEKHYWKCIYTWIKYLNYHVVHTNKDYDEIWLANKKSESIVIFKHGANSTQDVRFDKTRIQENQDNIIAFLGFKPKNYELYIFTDKMFTDENLNETKPVKFKVKIIREAGHVERIMPNFFVKKVYNRKTKHTKSYYKQRALNNNPIEKHMFKFAPVTYTLIAINIIIWLAMTLFLNRFSDLKLLDVGGLVHFNVVHGEWYRLITSIFLHYNFEHILMNMLSLFIFGKIVEAIVGHWRMAVIYIVAGLFGNFASLSFNTDTVSVGASGAIFGLIGAIFTFMYVGKQFNRKLIGQLLIVLLIMIGLSLFMQNVNIVAHIGGFIGGLLITLIGFYFKTNKNRFWFLIILILVLFIAAQIRIFTIKEDNIYNTIIRNEMKQGNYDDAKDMVKHTINKNYADDGTYYLNGLIKATLDSKAEGIAIWERGLREHPNSGLLNYQLAIANRSLDNKDKAKKYIKVALKSDPSNNDYINLNKELSDDSDSEN